VSCSVCHMGTDFYVSVPSASTKRRQTDRLTDIRLANAWFHLTTQVGLSEHFKLVLYNM
jgi:hypothetical protein